MSSTRKEHFATPAPVHPFVADDDDFFPALSTASRQTKKISGVTPATAVRPNAAPTNTQLNVGQQLQQQGLLAGGRSASRGRLSTAITDDSPVPKVPRRELGDGSVLLAAMDAVKTPVAAPKATQNDDELTQEFIPESQLATQEAPEATTTRKVPAKKATKATALRSSKSQTNTQDATVPTAHSGTTPTVPQQRLVEAEEPLTATQDALDVADGYTAPSPPPFFVQGSVSVSQSRVEAEAQAAENWQQMTKDFFAFIDKRSLNVTDRPATTPTNKNSAATAH